MADYPCDNHLTRYAGPSHRVYLNIFRDDQAVKFKASLCEACLSAWIADWLGHALHQVPAGSWDPPAQDEGLDDLWLDAEPSARPLGRAYRR
jgi:hypothetical protein